MSVGVAFGSHLDHAADVLRRAMDSVRRRTPLLSVAEAMQGQQMGGQHYAGIRAIPIVDIVGSVDRSADFDRTWRPRYTGEESRLVSLRRAFRDREFPPIDVFDINGQYFVSDGHHRVALARERGMLDIDAEVIRIHIQPQPGVRCVRLQPQRHPPCQTLGTA